MKYKVGDYLTIDNVLGDFYLIVKIESIFYNRYTVRIVYDSDSIKRPKLDLTNQSQVYSESDLSHPQVKYITKEEFYAEII